MISLRSHMTQQVLAFLFLHSKADFYVNQLARRLELDSGNLTRKLRALEKEGILKSEFKGKERYYSLNSSYPLLAEYKKIALKSFGLENVLKKALQDVPGLKKALIFGSYAKNKMDSSSDIDLLTVGRNNTIDLQKRIALVQKKMDREINLVHMRPQEFEKRKKKDPFLRSIFNNPRINLL